MQTFRFITFFFLFLIVQASLPANDSIQISSVVEKYVARNGFSGTILVAKKGVTTYQQSFGLAYRSTPDSIQNDYRFSIASVTKLFTSIRILQLVQAKKLDLGESLIHYLPQFEQQIAPEITIHHLLLHISGLPEEPNSVYTAPYAPADLLQRVLKKGRVQKIDVFNYNNVDYMLLGLLIERITGSSFQENINAHIISPLGMKNTGFLAYGNYPAKFAYSYSKRGNRLRQDPLFYIENFFAAGSMYSTCADLLRLDQALYSNQLLNEQSRKSLAVSYPEYTYAGYGVWNYNYPFLEAQPTIMERRGGILGANVVLVRLTDKNETIIILSNDNRFNPDSFGDEHNLREMLIRALPSQP